MKKIPLKHQKIIKEIIKEKKKDPKVISILLYGSFAKGTFHKKSDIDIEIIYKSKNYKTSHEIIEGIKIDYEFWPKEKLLNKLKKYPFLCYPYLSEKILYDPKNFAKKLKNKIKTYFKRNQKIGKTWKDWEKSNKVEYRR